MMYYVVTDRNNKDEETPVVDIFTERRWAERHAQELEESRGTLAVEEWENLNDLAGDDEELRERLQEKFSGLFPVNADKNTAGVAELSPRPAQHTPLPWTAEGATRIWHTGPGYGAVAIIADPECKNSGDFKEVDPTCARWDEAMGNMHLIIRAVNSHEALVEAVKLALTTPGMIKGRDALEAALRLAGVN